MSVGEGHPLGSQAVEVRRLDFRRLVAVGDVGHAHVVGVKDDYVGKVFAQRGLGAKKKQERFAGVHGCHHYLAARPGEDKAGLARRGLWTQKNLVVLNRMSPFFFRSQPPGWIEKGTP